MDLGTYATYRLPPSIASAFHVTTAQELADAVGAQGTLTPEGAREAEAAYDASRRGDLEPVRAFLGTRAGLAPDAVDRVMAALRR